jgi:AraC-like DNA-binding protein
VARFDYIAHYNGPEAEIRSRGTTGFDRLLIITQGSFFIEVDGVTRCAREGDAVFTTSDTEFTEWNAEAPPFRCYAVAFHWPERPVDIPLILHDSYGQLQVSARRLVTMQESFSTTIQTIRDYCLHGLLAELMSLAEIREDVSVERIRQYVLQNLKSKIRLDDLATVSGMSRYHFAHAYKALTGRSPMFDVRMMRMQAARNLVINSDLPLKAIADDVGMANAPHLATLFHRTYDMTISQMRAGRVIGCKS